jgi:hypothetical protein
MPTKTAKKPKDAAAKAGGGKANALQKPLQPSEELGALVGILTNPLIFSLVGIGAESAGFVEVSAQSGLEHRGGQGG